MGVPLQKHRSALVEQGVNAYEPQSGVCHKMRPMHSVVDAGMDVRMISLSHAHHARASGYDRLTDYVHCTKINPLSSWSISQKVTARVLRPMIARSGVRWYHRDNLMSELSAARTWHAPGKRLYHFLYGENSYRYLGAMKSTGRKHPIVCTFHTPRDRFSQVVHSRRHLRRIDACVSLTGEMRDFFTDIVGPDRSFHVHHGIDTSFFTPAHAAKPSGDRIECLAVGSHMRDFDMLYAAARRLTRIAPETVFTVVAGKEDLSRFTALGNVQVLRNVSDADLLGLYRRATLFVLPVRSVTANNALLEAMSCALPVLSTDLPGVHDYVTPECARVIPAGDGEALAQKILELGEDSAARSAMSTASRERAMELDWSVIADRTVKIYQEICG